MDLSSLNWMYILAGGLALVALAAIVYFVVFKSSSQQAQQPSGETQQPSDAGPEAESFQQESEENTAPESVEQYESAAPSEN